MDKKPQFEICRSFDGELCTTVNSLEDVLAEKICGDELKLKKEDQDLVIAVLCRILYNLEDCVREFREEELRGKAQELTTAATIRDIKAYLFDCAWKLYLNSEGTDEQNGRTSNCDSN